MFLPFHFCATDKQVYFFNYQKGSPYQECDKSSNVQRCNNRLVLPATLGFQQVVSDETAPRFPDLQTIPDVM